MLGYEEFKNAIYEQLLINSSNEAPRDTELFEMANLIPEQTGLPKGVIYFSTIEGSHGCRIKYYPKFPDRSEILTVSIPQLKIVEDKNSLSDYEKKQIVKFARINSRRIILFWYKGNDMTDPEFTKLKKSMKVNPEKLEDVSGIILKYK